MRVIYKGCAATVFSTSSLSITDKDGKEVYFTKDRTVETEEELKDFLKQYVKEHKLDKKHEEEQEVGQTEKIPD